MKKYPLLAIALMTLTACKRNSPQTKCLFDHQIDGITVSNEISEKRFSIELHDKSYFEFFDLNVGGYHAKIENNDISFSDSEGETIVFENNSYYFATRVNKRFIYLNYSSEMSEKINDKNWYISLRIYNKEFWREYN